MLKVGNFLLVGLFLVSVPLVGCKSGSDVDINAAFPEDVDLVYVVSYYDDEQRENFDNIVDKFPDFGLLGMAKAQIVSGLESEGISYEDDVEPILEEPWRLGFGMKFPAGETSETLSSLVRGMEVYGVLQLEEADELEDLIRDIAEKEDNTDYEEKGDFKIWTPRGAGGGVFFRYKDVYALTTTDYADDMMKRLESGEGLNKNKLFVEDSKDLTGTLGYFYFNMEKFGDVASQAYTEIGADDLAEQIKMIGTMFMSVSAKENGILGSIKMTADMELMKKFLSNQDYKIDLINKINGDGLVVYFEQFSLEPLFSSIYGLARIGNFIEYSQPTPGNTDDDVVVESPRDVDKFYPTSSLEINDDVVVEPLRDVDFANSLSYDDFIKSSAEYLEIDAEKLAGLIDSPFALAISTPEDKIIPSVSLYFKLEKDEVETAKSILAILDRDMDELLSELDLLIIEDGGKAGIIKKDLEIANGGGLRKLSVDWKALSSEDLDDLGIAGIDLDQVDTDLYYGLTGDDVLVLALFPNLPESYGKNVVADNAGFKKAMKNLEMGDFNSVYYLNLEQAIAFGDKFAKMWGFTEGKSIYSGLGYDIKPILDLFGSVSGGSATKDGVIKGSTFVEIK